MKLGTSLVKRFPMFSLLGRMLDRLWRIHLCCRFYLRICFLLVLGMVPQWEHLLVELSCFVGASVGIFLDEDVGNRVGTFVVYNVGIEFGSFVGASVDTLFCVDFGNQVGTFISEDVGIELGCFVGEDVGKFWVKMWAFKSVAF
jgi:hypothetical protein